MHFWSINASWSQLIFISELSYLLSTGTPHVWWRLVGYVEYVITIGNIKPPPGLSCLKGI
jgi:hypothetical protein